MFVESFFSRQGGRNCKGRLEKKAESKLSILYARSNVVVARLINERLTGKSFGDWKALKSERGSVLGQIEGISTRWRILNEVENST